jgi:hypothetical protein
MPEACSQLVNPHETEKGLSHWAISGRTSCLWVTSMLILLGRYSESRRSGCKLRTNLFSHARIPLNALEDGYLQFPGAQSSRQPVYISFPPSCKAPRESIETRGDPSTSDRKNGECLRLDESPLACASGYCTDTNPTRKRGQTDALPGFPHSPARPCLVLRTRVF